MTHAGMSGASSSITHCRPLAVGGGMKWYRPSTLPLLDSVTVKDETWEGREEAGGGRGVGGQDN